MKLVLLAFSLLKEKLMNTPILVSPEWSLPLEFMCDASDFPIVVVLGQRKVKYFKSIYYASKNLMDAQANYTTTENELIATVFVFDKFRAYLILYEIILYTTI